MPSNRPDNPAGRDPAPRGWTPWSRVRTRRCAMWGARGGWVWALRHRRSKAHSHASGGHPQITTGSISRCRGVGQPRRRRRGCLTPSFRRMFETWTLAVLSDTKSSSPIWRLVRPAATSVRTSASRGVSPSRCAELSSSVMRVGASMLIRVRRDTASISPSSGTASSSDATAWACRSDGRGPVRRAGQTRRLPLLSTMPLRSPIDRRGRPSGLAASAQASASDPVRRGQARGRVGEMSRCIAAAGFGNRARRTIERHRFVSGGGRS